MKRNDRDECERCRRLIGQDNSKNTKHCIRRRELRERKSTHAWFTAKTEILVQEKNDAEGKPREREAAEKCSAGILAFFGIDTQLHRKIPWLTFFEQSMVGEVEVAARYQNFEHTGSEV